MINGTDFYKILCAIVPLYIAMILSYASVKWWKIFNPDQIAGINRFVALFMVPLLVFDFLGKNNPYKMNFRFMAADTLQKVIVVVVLAIWCRLSSRGSLKWSITLSSVATLSNTLVLGVPLLSAMYGDVVVSLLLEAVVLQCILWNNVFLIACEYKGAKLLLKEMLPVKAGRIASIRVDSDVLSLDGKESLQTEAEVGDDNKIHVIVKKSASTRSDPESTTRTSNLTSADTYSLQSSSLYPTPRRSSFNEIDFYSTFNGRNMNTVNPIRQSTGNTGLDEESGVGGVSDPSHPNEAQESLAGLGLKKLPPNGTDGKDLETLNWSSSASQSTKDSGRVELSISNKNVEAVTEDRPKTEIHEDSKITSVPPTSVLTKLILIMVWRKLRTNPTIYASLLGLVWSLVSYRWGIKLPVIIENSITILSSSGMGMAMFSLGLFLSMQPRIIYCGKRVAALTMSVRFLVGPAVMAAASYAVGLRGEILQIAIVQAALPQALITFIFAKEYNVHPEIQCTGVIIGMLVSLPVTITYYILLGL